MKMRAEWACGLMPGHCPRRTDADADAHMRRHVGVLNLLQRSATLAMRFKPERSVNSGLMRWKLVPSARRPERKHS
jgi:hypothetical protein